MGMAWQAERHQAVEVEVRASLGALDDVANLEDASAGVVVTVGRPKAIVARARGLVH